MRDHQELCGRCAHPQAAHTKHPHTYVHDVTFFTVTGCAATVSGPGYSYPCDCPMFVHEPVGLPRT